MKYLTLDKLKKHLNVDFDDDDSYIQTLGDMAEEMIAQHIDQPLADICDSQGILPLPVQHAIKLLVGNFYRTRESIGLQYAVVPLSYEYLLAPYKKYTNSGL